MIYAVFVTGLNLFMGYAGQVSFGQSAFAALGGYGTAILCAGHGWEPLAGLLASMALSGVVALVVGYPTLRLRGHYLAMATFALGLIAYELTVQWSGLTQGYMGYAGIPPLGIAGYSLDSDPFPVRGPGRGHAVRYLACRADEVLAFRARTARHRG